MMARRSASSSLRLNDVAVLYRTNAQSRALEEALRKHAMPYRLVGAVRFYDRREIRDLMAYLKLIANPSDDEAFRRAVGVPKRGLGETTIELLAEASRARGVPMLEGAQLADVVGTLRPAARIALAEFVRLISSLRERATEAAVDELLKELVDAIRYGDYLRAEGPESAERLDNVRELIDGAAETVADELGEVGLRPLDHFLQRARLVAEAAGAGADADAITLMTMHNAKGLEFPVVFITGLEDGLFPLAKAYDDPPLLEEERRLFYVGITRAERKLYITFAEERRRNGELMAVAASRAFSTTFPRRDGREAEHDQGAELRSLDDARRRRQQLRQPATDGASRGGRDVEEFFNRPSPATRRPGIAGRQLCAERVAGGRVAGRRRVRDRRAREAPKVRQRARSPSSAARVATRRSKSISTTRRSAARRSSSRRQTSSGATTSGRHDRRRSPHRGARAARAERRARAVARSRVEHDSRAHGRAVARRHERR